LGWWLKLDSADTHRAEAQPTPAPPPIRRQSELLTGGSSAQGFGVIAVPSVPRMNFPVGVVADNTTSDDYPPLSDPIAGELLAVFESGRCQRY
jgi:hypothetical protein